jgi:hypothetical protein
MRLFVLIAGNVTQTQTLRFNNRDGLFWRL